VLCVMCVFVCVVCVCVCEIFVYIYTCMTFARMLTDAVVPNRMRYGLVRVVCVCVVRVV